MSEESVWALPPREYCTDREAAGLYPYSHGEKPSCPFHHQHPERRGVIPEKVDLNWRDWGMYRERYVRAIDEENADYFMAQMLECVTPAIPPYAPEPVIRMTTEKTPEHWRPSDRFLVVISVVAVILAVTAFLGILL